MERSPATLLLSWLLAPVAAVLIQSALSLPHQAYTGAVLTGYDVVEVTPGSPAERAGLRPGDVFARRPPPRSGLPLPGGPLSAAEPGHPLSGVIVRDGHLLPLWLVPEPLPDVERRLRAALLAFASAFVLLGGWVWSERRDALARTFFLMCLCFAWLLKPLPTWDSAAFAWAHELLLIGASLALPALWVHFFVLFPESRARGALAGWVKVTYAGAAALFAVALVLTGLQIAGRPVPPTAEGGLQIAAALWFALGGIGALAIFLTSYARARDPDARRRLRVALIGTTLGIGPLAALIAVKNLLPGTSFPGDRWAILLTLLVPASLAWATVVHRIFDFRVALRAAAVTLLLAGAGAVAYGVGEWLTGSWWPEGGAGLAGGALAFVAFAASLAGPAAPWLAAIAARVVPDEHEHRLSEWKPEAATAAGEPPRDGLDPADASLLEAAAAIERYLRIEGCMALVPEPHGTRVIAPPRANGLREPGPGIAARIAVADMAGVMAVADLPLEEADRTAVDSAGFRWALPVGSDPVRAVLLLGGRLAGAWLSRRETWELERLADRLAITLENQALRREATTHGELERELRVAGAIQAHLLPRRAPVLPTLDCSAATLSSEPVGGDYYDFVEGEGRDFTLAVGDAAGKGVPAALILAQVQARFRPLAREAASPGRILGALNQELVRLDQPEKFMGLLCARVEVRRARVVFANAGLTPPLVYRPGRGCEEVLAGGVLLGVSVSASYPDQAVDLGAGDVVVVYTDGLTEARRGEELFGVERVEEVLVRTAHRRAADVMAELIAVVREFTDRPLDDLTVVVLKQLTDPVHPPARPLLRSRRAGETFLKEATFAADPNG